MKQLGIGVLWQAELDALCREPGLVDVIELEPELFWRDAFAGCSKRTIDRLASLPQPKLFHGLGAPVAAVAPRSDAHRCAFLRDVRALNPVWVGEHLGFNCLADGAGGSGSAVFLPAAQNPNAVALAANNLRTRRLELGLPIAFETSVNYLSTRAGEMADGAFLAATAEAADCGIVLDLHSLWCNARNGRASLAEVLAAIPLDRVWELQLSGGSSISGYCAHTRSGLIDDALMAFAEALIPRLFNLGAIIFEIRGIDAARLGLSAIAGQLEALHGLWRRRPEHSRVPPRARPPRLQFNGLHSILPEEWEAVLASLVLGEEVEGPLADQLRGDPALPLYGLLSRGKHAAQTASRPYSNRSVPPFSEAATPIQ